MSKYTPATDEVRETYVQAYTRNHDTYTTGVTLEAREGELRIAFDRWLSQVMADAWGEGLSAGADLGLSIGERIVGTRSDWPSVPKNPYHAESIESQDNDETVSPEPQDENPVLVAMTEYAQAIRGDWSNFDGRTERSIIEGWVQELRQPNPLHDIEWHRDAPGTCALQTGVVSCYQQQPKGASNMTTPELRIGSLFAGYGGLDLGIEAVLDARTAWVSEIDPGACKVLASRFPDVPNLGDVTGIDWTTVPPVDIIAGGSPCQDLSTAGRRAGMTEGTRSNLWVSMREGIAHLKPTFVVWENVRGAYSAAADSDLGWTEGLLDQRSPDQFPKKEDRALRALGRVLGDLSDLGYDAEWRGLRASDVGACHGRFRVFLLAWRRAEFADADHAGPQGSHDPQGAAQARLHGHPVAGAGGSDLTLLPTPKASDGIMGLPRTSDRPAERATFLATRIAYDTPAGADGGIDFGGYAPAVRRWEAALGRTAPSPVEPNPSGKPRLSPRFVEWMMGLPAGWVTDIEGVSRASQLQMLGNGVVPQQAVVALTDMLPNITTRKN